MEHIFQKGPECLITCAAMILEAKVDTLKAEIGHDGSAKVFNKSRIKNRGYHIQEIIDCALRRNIALQIIEPYPVGENSGEEFIIFQEHEARDRFIRHIKNSTGILCGYRLGSPHAVVWHQGLILDPDGGRIKCIDDLNIKEYWMKIRF